MCNAYAHSDPHIITIEQPTFLTWNMASDPMDGNRGAKYLIRTGLPSSGASPLISCTDIDTLCETIGEKSSSATQIQTYYVRL